MVYDLNLSETKSLEAIATKFLKKWTGLPHPATTSILYRSRQNKGLHLTPLSLHFKKMQILKIHTIKYSDDSNLTTLYQMSKASDAEYSRVWKPSKELEELESIVEFDRKFSGQSSTTGLGFIKKRTLQDPTAQHPKDITSKLTSLDEKDRLIKFITLLNKVNGHPGITL